MNPTSPSVAPEHSLDPDEIDAWAVSVLADEALQRRIRRLTKFELSRVRNLAANSIDQWREAGRSRGLERLGGLGPLEVHRRLVEGLPGVSVIVA